MLNFYATLVYQTTNTQQRKKTSEIKWPIREWIQSPEFKWQCKFQFIQAPFLTHSHNDNHQYSVHLMIIPLSTALTCVLFSNRTAYRCPSHRATESKMSSIKLYMYFLYLIQLKMFSFWLFIFYHRWPTRPRHNSSLKLLIIPGILIRYHWDFCEF